MVDPAKLRLERAGKVNATLSMLMLASKKVFHVEELGAVAVDRDLGWECDPGEVLGQHGQAPLVGHHLQIDQPHVGPHALAGLDVPRS